MPFRSCWLCIPHIVDQHITGIHCNAHVPYCPVCYIACKFQVLPLSASCSIRSFHDLAHPCLADSLKVISTTNNSVGCFCNPSALIIVPSCSFSRKSASSPHDCSVLQTLPVLIPAIPCHVLPGHAVPCGTVRTDVPSSRICPHSFAGFRAGSDARAPDASDRKESTVPDHRPV